MQFIEVHIYHKENNGIVFLNGRIRTDLIQLYFEPSLESKEREEGCNTFIEFGDREMQGTKAIKVSETIGQIDFMINPVIL